MKLFSKHIIPILTVLFILLSLSVKAQQDPMFTQYMNNPIVINPAYAGSTGNVNVSGIFRKQWIGFNEWSPTTTSMSVNTPFLSYKVGLGLTYINDYVHPIVQNGLYADYAYHIQFDQGNNLSLGLKGGFNHYNIDLLSLESYEYDTWIALYGKRSLLLPNFGIGAYFYKPNKYFLGLSIPKLIRNSFVEKDNDLVALTKEEIHFFLTGGIVIKVDPVIKFKQTFMTRYVTGAPVSLDVTSTVILYDRFWAGLSYRFGDSMSAHIRMQLSDRFQLGYAYDLTNSRLKAYNNGTHEVYISYDFSFKGRRILSPRYF